MLLLSVFGVGLPLFVGFGLPREHLSHALWHIYLFRLPLTFFVLWGSSPGFGSGGLPSCGRSRACLSIMGFGVGHLRKLLPLMPR